MIDRLCIIGVGLIGGSLARALREAGVCRQIIGCGRSDEHLQRAQKLGVIDEYTTDIAQAVKGADIIVLSVPLRAMPAIFRILDAHIAPGSIVTDVGSAKSTVVQAATANLVNTLHQFVPGHPIAGTEQSGVEASFASLFRNRRVILTPLPQNTEADIARIRAMWEQTGAEVQLMPVDHHDEVLAATSHLPHILAFGLVDTLARMSDRDEIFQYAAGGFRDFSRIASSDPVMWRDICIENSAAILQVMDYFLRDLAELQGAIAAGDLQTVESVFRRAKQARDRYTGNSLAQSEKPGVENL